MKEEYYFVSYVWRSVGMTANVHANEIIVTNPLQWLVDVRSLSEDTMYQILFYAEISKEQYNQFIHHLG